jgi:hypothetical protein
MHHSARTASVLCCTSLIVAGCSAGHATSAVSVKSRTASEQISSVDQTSTTATGSATSALPTPISKADAVSMVQSMHGVVDPNATLQAKLATIGAFHEAMGGSVKTLTGTESTPVWIVEAIGDFHPALQEGEGTTFAWGIVAISTTERRALEITAGPGPAPSYWDSIPDQSGT